MSGIQSLVSYFNPSNGFWPCARISLVGLAITRTSALFELVGLMAFSGDIHDSSSLVAMSLGPAASTLWKLYQCVGIFMLVGGGLGAFVHLLNPKSIIIPQAAANSLLTV